MPPDTGPYRQDVPSVRLRFGLIAGQQPGRPVRVGERRLLTQRSAQRLDEAEAHEQQDGERDQRVGDRRMLPPPVRESPQRTGRPGVDRLVKDWGWGMSYAVWDRLNAITLYAKNGKWSLTND